MVKSRGKELQVDVAKLAIIMIFGIPLAAVIGGILLAMLKILRSGSSRAEGELRAEETRLIQEIHEGLVRMEERVEALETLLLDRDERAREAADEEKAERQNARGKRGRR